MKYKNIENFKLYAKITFPLKRKKGRELRFFYSYKFPPNTPFPFFPPIFEKIYYEQILK
jgi:hypothetical protein